MVQITDYERRGDLDAPFELSKKDERAQKEREHIREAVRRDVPILTWEEYVAGAPCSGCGRPYRDEEPWDFRGTMRLTEEERVRYEAEQDRFKQGHGECRAMRHSVSRSLTTHCGKCCPPPPLSPTQLKEIGRIFASPTPPRDLMRWRLRLYCGHVVEQTAQRTHLTIHAAFTSSTRCIECGLDPATIVAGEAIGLEEEPPRPGREDAPAAASSRSRKATKAELESRVREFEAEVRRLREG